MMDRAKSYLRPWRMLLTTMENQHDQTTPEPTSSRRTVLRCLAGATVVGGVSALATPVAAGTHEVEGDRQPDFVQGNVTPRTINLEANGVITVRAIFAGDYQPDWLAGDALVAGPRFGSKESLGISGSLSKPTEALGDEILQALASNKGAPATSIRELGNDTVQVQVRTSETGIESGDAYGLLIWSFEDPATGELRTAIVVDSGVEYIESSQ